MFSRFFIDRPIFASVLSLFIVIVGVIAYGRLGVSEFPEIAPPTIQVNTSFPGASAETDYILSLITSGQPVERVRTLTEASVVFERYADERVIGRLYVPPEDADRARALIRGEVHGPTRG